MFKHTKKLYQTLSAHIVKFKAAIETTDVHQKIAQLLNLKQETAQAKEEEYFSVKKFKKRVGFTGAMIFLGGWTTALLFGGPVMICVTMVGIGLPIALWSRGERAENKKAKTLETIIDKEIAATVIKDSKVMSAFPQLQQNFLGKQFNTATTALQDAVSLEKDLAKYAPKQELSPAA